MAIMPFELHIDVVPEVGGKINVEHVFYGYTEAECRQVYAAHADGCEFLGPAIAEDRIEEELIEIDEDDWPSYEAESADAEEDEEEEPETEEE